jgi:hypothetical protein
MLHSGFIRPPAIMLLRPLQFTEVIVFFLATSVNSSNPIPPHHLYIHYFRRIKQSGGKLHSIGHSLRNNHASTLPVVNSAGILREPSLPRREKSLPEQPELPAMSVPRQHKINVSIA